MLLPTIIPFIFGYSLSLCFLKKKPIHKTLCTISAYELVVEIRWKRINISPIQIFDYILCYFNNSIYIFTHNNIFFSFIRGVLILLFVLNNNSWCVYSVHNVVFCVCVIIVIINPWWVEETKFRFLSIVNISWMLLSSSSVINKDDCFDDSQRDEFTALHPYFLCARNFSITHSIAENGEHKTPTTAIANRPTKKNTHTVKTSRNENDRQRTEGM